MKKFTQINEANTDVLKFTIDEFEDVMQLEWETMEGLEDLYEIIEVEIEDTDLGKGIEHKRSIIKRLADGRFFEFKYSDGGSQYSLSIGGLANPRIMVGEEVYPHTVTTVVYKSKPQ